MTIGKNILTPLFLLFVITITLIYFGSQPSRGHLVTSQKQIPTNISKADSFSSIKQTKLFSFDTPNNYKVQENQPETKNFLERIVLLGQGVSSKKIVISASSAPVAKIDDLSSVQFRRLKTDQYTESTLTLSGEKGLLFVKNLPSLEITALIFRDQHLFTISTTANTVGELGEKELMSDFQKIVNSWSWK